MCFTVGDGLGAERLHNTAIIGNIPIRDRSALNNITKTSTNYQVEICPSLCVGDLTC